MPAASYSIATRYRSRVVVSNGLDRVEGPNLVTYQGGDILAALAAGRPSHAVSHVYFEFRNDASAFSPAAAARSDTAASRQAVASPYDLIRAPLIAVPQLAAADGNHAANRVTFHALTTATTGLLHGLSFSSGANSKVYAVCLVAAVGGADRTQDLIYARFLPTSVVPAGPSGQLSCTWVCDWN